jgi:hypothetical protein
VSAPRGRSQDGGAVRILGEFHLYAFQGGSLSMSQLPKARELLENRGKAAGQNGEADRKHGERFLCGTLLGDKGEQPTDER